MAKGRKFNLLAYYVHRYMRLTPSFMALLSIATYILPKMGSGALWQSTKIQSDCCKEKWWAKLLYIHNYVYSHDLRCLIHTWYLAVDMQLFWVSPLIVYPLYKKHKLGLIILSTAIVASVITPAVIEALNKYQLYFFPDEKYDHETLLHFYVLTSNRAGPWLLGILTGYLLATDHGIPTPGLRKTGWILAVLAFAYSLFTYRIYQQEYYQSNIYFKTFNAGVGKHIWAFGICWIIYISLVGEGGIICQFLSFPMYLPLGRISYSIYLLHYVVQTMEIKSVRVPMYINEFQMVNFYVSDLVICIFGGFVFCLMFESPFLVLEKLIFAHGTERISQSSVENETNNPKRYSKKKFSIENKSNNLKFYE
ncbi:O-acyltransferase like protein-like [Cotesia typhae]|uniref:O-acyltransferase like protein-like n=1 Tax=Cotesia typhae TaxID=2053667 RepID=UPI003D68EAE8